VACATPAKSPSNGAPLTVGHHHRTATSSTHVRSAPTPPARRKDYPLPCRRRIKDVGEARRRRQQTPQRSGQPVGVPRAERRCEAPLGPVEDGVGNTPRSDDPNNPLSSSPGIRARKRPHQFDEPVVEQRNPGLQRMHHRRVVHQRQQCRGQGQRAVQVHTRGGRIGRALRRQRVAQPPALPDHHVEDPGPPESVNFERRSRQVPRRLPQSRIGGRTWRHTRGGLHR
jgi:hypothetical protein